MANHLIDADDAADMTASFRSHKESILVDAYQGVGTLPICETFDREGFDIILGDTNCTGIRIYLAMDSSLKVRLVVTGVNSSHEDIAVPSTHPSNGLGVDCVVENGTRCPTTCPPPSALNS